MIKITILPLHRLEIRVFTYESYERQVQANWKWVGDRDLFKISLAIGLIATTFSSS